MPFHTQMLPRPLKLAFTVCLAAALCGWFAANPWAALRFWSGVLIGTLGVTLGWPWWKRMVPHRADLCFKIFALILLAWSALALLPQRDVPVIAAPFGVWFSLTVAMAISRPWLKRA